MKLYRDRKQDVLTRDFAVQHIGLYAQALNRRGEYDAASAGKKKNKMKILMISMFCFLLLISFLWGYCIALSQSRDRRRLLKWFFYYQFLFCLLYVVLDCFSISIQRIV